MLHHHDLPDRRYDCYVIGGGPAGLTLALELAKTNHSVLVFETGGLTEPRNDMPNVVNYGHFRDGWWNAHSIRVLGGTSRALVRVGAPRRWMWTSPTRRPEFSGRSPSPIWRPTTGAPLAYWTVNPPFST